MDDLISRQDVISAVLASNFSACTVYGRSEEGMATAKELIQTIKNLPSAQPERKKGFWYALEKGDKGYSAGDFKCSVCGEPNRCYVPKPHFCPSCGADMRGENDGE